MCIYSYYPLTVFIYSYAPTYTQVLIRLFEDREDKTQLRCEILLSPGAVGDPWKDKSSFLAPTVCKYWHYTACYTCLCILCQYSSTVSR